MNFVEEDIRVKVEDCTFRADRGEWKKKTCCADPTYGK